MIDWLQEPKNRVKAAWVQLFVCLIGWPLSAFTFASQEPQGILGLSWFAVIQSAILLIVTTDVRKEQDEQEGE